MLARLARDGMVIASAAESGGGPDRKQYAITEAGREQLFDWLTEPRRRCAPRCVSRKAAASR